MKIIKYYDPGHGFYAVPHTLIQKLGIADKITSFSRMTATMVFLEEDGDALVLFEAVNKAGIEIEVVGKYAVRARCRNYGPYVKDALGGLKIGQAIRYLKLDYTVVGESRSRYQVKDVEFGVVYWVAKLNFTGGLTIAS